MKYQIIDYFFFKFHLFRIKFLKNLFHSLRVMEFMNKDEKRLFDIELKPQSLIFDVGGYEGTFTGRIFKKNQKCFFYIFEPIYSYYKKIKKRFENIENIYVLPFGLSSKDKDVPLEVNFDKTSHSIKTFSDGDFELCSLRNISNFIKEKNIETIDLLKLNVEGAEYEILSNLIENNMIHKVNTLLIQFHLNESEDYYKYKNLRKKILETHNCEYNVIFVWEKFKLKAF